MAEVDKTLYIYPNRIYWLPVAVEVPSRVVSVHIKIGEHKPSEDDDSDPLKRVNEFNKSFMKICIYTKERFTFHPVFRKWLVAKDPKPNSTITFDVDQWPGGFEVSKPQLFYVGMVSSQPQELVLGEDNLWQESNFTFVLEPYPSSVESTEIKLPPARVPMPEHTIKPSKPLAWFTVLTVRYGKKFCLNYISDEAPHHEGEVYVRPLTAPNTMPTAKGSMPSTFQTGMLNNIFDRANTLTSCPDRSFKFDSRIKRAIEANTAAEMGKLDEVLYSHFEKKVDPGWVVRDLKPQDLLSVDLLVSSPPPFAKGQWGIDVLRKCMNEIYMKQPEAMDHFREKLGKANEFGDRLAVDELYDWFLRHFGLGFTRDTMPLTVQLLAEEDSRAHILRSLQRDQHQRDLEEQEAELEYEAEMRSGSVVGLGLVGKRGPHLDARGKRGGLSDQVPQHPSRLKKLMAPVAIYEGGNGRHGRRRMSKVRNAREIFRIMRRTAKQFTSRTAMVHKDLLQCALRDLKVNSPLLVTLNLSCESVLPQHIPILGEALRPNTTLKELDLSNNRIGNTGACELVKHLDRNGDEKKEKRPTLKTLCMNACDIGCKGAAFLIRCERYQVQYSVMVLILLLYSLLLYSYCYCTHTATVLAATVLAATVLTAAVLTATVLILLLYSYCYCTHFTHYTHYTHCTHYNTHYTHCTHYNTHCTHCTHYNTHCTHYNTHYTHCVLPVLTIGAAVAG
jgi:hypothetical protein